VPEITPGQRVYHRCADAFASVVEVDGDDALVKYEWPFDPNWEPQTVPVAEIVSAWEVQGG
jgi:hypothetical protein